MDGNTVCVDLDGVIARGHANPEEYHLAEVMPGAIEALRRIRAAGWFVVIHTARWEKDREVTTRWLAEKGVPYDKLVLGKPLASVYIDDRALRFTDWEAVEEEVLDEGYCCYVGRDGFGLDGACSFGAGL